MEKIAPGVRYLGFSASNVYLLGEPDGGAYVIVDSGMPGHFDAIKSAAEREFGEDSKPAAIVLTHAHIDHYGSALALATYWNVPVYVHPMDLPYLTGQSKMPPTDPTVGGFFALVSRVIPVSGTDLGEFVLPLPSDNSIPGLDDWQWLPTPGHTPGHVSLFRESDRTVIAGDAILTVDLDSAPATIAKTQSLARPVSPLTYDWLQVRRSLQTLAALRPRLIASGHGVPMEDTSAGAASLADKLQHFANEFLPPLHGRYVAEPAAFDPQGVVSVPPPVSDPLPKTLIGVGVAAAIAVGVYVAMSRQKEQSGGER